MKTDNEIIKLLNESINLEDIKICLTNSAFSDTKNETYIDLSEIRDLINRQQAEIKRLTAKSNHSIGIDNTKENGYFPFD